jgi:hypothetical protein
MNVKHSDNEHKFFEKIIKLQVRIHRITKINNSAKKTNNHYYSLRNETISGWTDYSRKQTLSLK